MARKNKQKKSNTAIVKLTGKGAYKEKKEVTRLGKALRMLGGLGGSAVGGMVGHPLAGGTLGTSLGAAISKWLGAGAYSVRVNSILKPDSTIPMMHNTGQSIIVRHKEFICDVTAGTGTPTAYDVLASYALNPGLSASFPWLSTIAQQFQEYTWRGMVFHFISTSGESVASANTALGTVMLHTDYRVTAAAPVNKNELLNEYFASDSKPSDSFVHPIECDPKENPYNVQYVRTGAVPSGEDAKSYDLGKLNVATVGCPSAGAYLGELWVTYEVELRKPQINSFGSSLGAHFDAAGDIAVATPFGGPAYIGANYNDLGVTISGKVITFPKGTQGNFFLSHSMIGVSGSTLSSTYNSKTLTNCTALTAGWAYSDEVRSNDVVGIALRGGGVQMVFKINDPSKVASVTIDYTTITNATYSDLHIFRISPNFA